MKKLFISGYVILFLLLFACGGAQGAATTTITLDPTTKFQTITGWEAASQSGELECQGFENYAANLFDEAVFDLGINRVRVSIKSGVENPVDYYTQYFQGLITRDDWKVHWHEAINDNDDPLAINPQGFHFGELDQKIEAVVIPLMERLELRGEKLYVNVTYVDFNLTDWEHRDYPDEYAEFVLATYQHLNDKYGFVPDSWEVVLEPENAHWGGDHIGRAIVATAQRLKDNGFTPVFVAPSTMAMSRAVEFLDELIAIPGAIQYVKEFSYHRYAGVSEESLKEIVSRAAQYDLDTAMLELIGATYETLHEDLLLGENSAWQQFTLAYCGNKDNGGTHFQVDNSDVNNPTFHMQSRTKFLRQYFKYARAGAVRIGASSDSNEMNPLAFMNQDSSFVVVIKADQAGSFRIRGLPTARYGIFYTTNEQYDVHLPVVDISNGAELSSSIPGKGVITIYRMPADEPSGSMYLPVLQSWHRQLMMN